MSIKWYQRSRGQLECTEGVKKSQRKSTKSHWSQQESTRVNKGQQEPIRDNGKVKGMEELIVRVRVAGRN